MFEKYCRRESENRTVRGKKISGNALWMNAAVLVLDELCSCGVRYHGKKEIIFVSLVVRRVMQA